VLYISFELRQLIELVHCAIDAYAYEALSAQLVEQIGLLAFAADDKRREDHQPCVFGQRQHVIHHLRDALRGQHVVVVRTMWVTDARIEKTQIVVYLSNRADGRTRIVRGRFLLDSDRRREAFDQIHVRFFHELQELSSVRRQRFDVAPLSFGVQRVECER
jgi:hypothetical protein